ncbi:hypothetical protein M433DRAFT_159604 [Acidomyces richmondensis BFW]|nr:MAG: hypothetical protein FE78DRAFT_87967 [Acidomyces sp. 'richmondensis']KYG40999.1 hypothetical protein M433DRAFT_159604 [Acidomyces richmondensis BFW]
MSPRYPATLRSILRAPANLRPLLLQSSGRAPYHSHEHPESQPYRGAESAILSSALAHVPAHGFTHHALVLGAKDAGYLDISTNLFPEGPFALVKYHLVTQRLGLKDRFNFPGPAQQPQKMAGGVGRKVRALVLERLKGNVDAGVVGRWQEALGVMSLVENVPQSARELWLLSDEMWFLAGDTEVDGSWYTKRASLAAVYAAVEVYQTTDQSTEFRDTEAFLDRRLEEVKTVGGLVSGTLEWAGFQAGALVNLMRSKGVRI